MTDNAPQARPWPRLKVLYLLAISAAVFAVPAVEATRPARWIVIPALLSLQVAILATCVPVRELIRPVLRLKWLFAFLLVCYTFLPGEAEDRVLLWQPVAAFRPIPLNLTGLERAALMCLQIATVILVSAVVRVTGSSTDLVDGLHGFGVPRLFALSVDTTLALLGGIAARGSGSGSGRGSGMGDGRGRMGGGDGHGGGRGRRRQAGETVAGVEVEDRPVAEPTPPLAALRRILRGDVRFFIEAIENSLARARDQVGGTAGPGLDERLVHDVSVISGVALAMMSLKLLKVLPGLPFLPGWKTLFFYPLYILAAHLTYSRWGGTTAGSIMGVLGYLQGDGRYGVFEILKHVVPGLVIDLAWPLFRRLPRSALVYCLLGLIAAIARTTTEFAVMLLIQARLEAYLFVVLTLSSNLVAGTLSGLVTFFILPAFRGLEIRDRPPDSSPQNGAEAAADDKFRTAGCPAVVTRPDGFRQSESGSEQVEESEASDRAGRSGASVITDPASSAADPSEGPL